MKATRLGSLLLRSCFAQERPTYSNSVVNKIVISRTPGERMAFYFDCNTTVDQMKSQVASVFSEFEIVATSSVKPFGTAYDHFKENEQYRNFKDLPFIDALILNKLHIAELSENNEVELLYGIEVKEFNLTNRINLPYYVEETVTEVSADWSEGNLTVGDALSFENIRRFEDGPLNKQTGPQISYTISPEEEQARQESIATVMNIEQFKKDNNALFAESRVTMVKLLTLMSANWIILFGITYGKYGWDVGEPIAYLTNLGVDLVAMIGYFEMDSSMEKKIERERNVVSHQLNMHSTKQIAEWRTAYLSRKMYH